MEFPGCIVPPIPEKDITAKVENIGMFSSNDPKQPSGLIAYRQRALRKFLVRVGAHPKLQNADVLCDFLQLGADELLKRSKQLSRKTYDIVSLPASSRVKEAFAAQPTTPEYTRWEETSCYIEKLEGLLRGMRERMNKIMHNRVGLGKSYKEWGVTFMAVGDVDQDDRETSEIIKKIGEHTTRQEANNVEQANNECIHVAESITYYQGMCTSIKHAIRRLIKLMMTRDSIEESLRKAKLKVDTLEGELRAKAQEKADELAEKHESTVQLTVEITKELESELSRFHNEKSYDFKSILNTTVDLSKNFAKKSYNSWETVANIFE